MTDFFHHRANGAVSIRSGGDRYVDTLEHFEADFGQAVPELPAGIVSRVYEPGIRHPLNNAAGVVDGGPIPWAFGDAAIAAVGDLIAAKHARENPPPAPPTIDDLKAYAADRRWARETGGITVSGVPVATDDRSKLMIIGARAAADADPQFSTEWKAADGGFVTLNAAAVIGISNAVSAFVNACFAMEASVIAAIAAEDITTPAEIEAAFAGVSSAF